jgi:transcriptional regulator with XRE-family HTH domain
VKHRLVAFADYLDALRRVHGVETPDVAAVAGVSEAEVRRWLRGTYAPAYATIHALTERYGGDPKMVYLAVVLERFARQVGCTLDDAAGLPFSRRSGRPSRRRAALAVDRRQLSLLGE